MSPKVKRRFHTIIRRSGIRPERALEVGGLMGEDSLLRFPELAGAERYCLNLVELPSDGEVTAVKGNANDMSVFKTRLVRPRRLLLDARARQALLALGGRDEARAARRAGCS